MRQTGHMARKKYNEQIKQRPEIYTDIYGKVAPDAAKAGVGARSIEQIRQATDARRNAIPVNMIGKQHASR